MRILLLILLLIKPLFAQQVMQTWGFRAQCYPYILVPFEEFEYANFVDFENDGLLETVSFYPRKSNDTPPHFQIKDANGDIHVRVNYDPKVIFIRRMDFIDADGDNIPEIFFPFIKNDSLFIDVYKYQGTVELICRFFIVKGSPRKKNGNVYPWDPEIKKLYFLDIDNNGKKELLTILNVSHARVKRGIYLNSYPDGALMDSLTFGAQPGTPFLDDFDNDGAPELILHTGTPSNGALANGFSDIFPYLIWFELIPRIHVKNFFQLSDQEDIDTKAFYLDFTGDGKKELVIFTVAWGVNARMEIRIFDPSNLELRMQKQYDFRIEDVIPFTSPSKPGVQFLVAKREKELAIIDNDFLATTLFYWPEKINYLHYGPDLDSDGYAEYIVRGSLNSVLLDYNFRLLTKWPNAAYVCTRPAYKTKKKEILLRGGIKVRGYKVERNRLYWVHRNIFPFLWLSLSLLFILLVLFSVKEHVQHVSINQFVDYLVETDARAIAIVDKKLRVLNYNPHLVEWFDLRNSSHRKLPQLHECFEERRPVREALLAWRDGSLYMRRELSFSLETEAGLRTLKMTIEPLPTTFFSRRTFLIAFTDLSIQAELAKIKSWTRLAQRVAHDLKNPLGAILLVIQKMRTLVSRKPPDLDKQLENHFSKIEDRIESLRVMTRNFMKYINLESPQFVVVDLSAFLRKALEALRLTCPPDIRIIGNFSKSDAAKINIDTEQMHSVIENLVNNAIDAMPEGGRISVTTRLARRLQFAQHDERPRDYAIIEIRDNGKGIPPEAIDRLFEPNFSYSKESSGLGLAIVQKIINEHHGQIEVESQVGVGSIFSIYLPLFVKDQNQRDSA